MRKELGKITRFEIGIGGYNGAMFGLSVTLEWKGGGVQDFDGTWIREPDERCQWNKEDQLMCWAKMCQRVIDLMCKAKVEKTSEMIGIPVEITLGNGRLDTWRILEEVL